MTEREKTRAEQSTAEAKQQLQDLEGQLSALTAQLHAARDAHQAAIVRMEVCSCSCGLTFASHAVLLQLFSHRIIC